MTVSISPVFFMGRLAIVAAIIFGAAPVLANESKFSFKMEHRYVSGNDNGVMHAMDRGTLTVVGELWAVNCAVVDEKTGRTAVPELVRINVMEEGSVVDGPATCAFAVTPSVQIGKKVHFEVTCNNVRQSKFYLIAYQVKDDDRCVVEAAGSLKTR